MKYSAYIDLQRINRKFMNSMWLFVLATSLLEAFHILTDRSLSFDHDYIQQMIGPAVFQIVLLLLLEGIILRNSKYREHLMICCSVIQSLIFLNFHYSSDSLVIVTLFPILITGYYLSYSKVIFSLACSLIALFIIYFSHELIRKTFGTINLVMVLATLVGYSIIIMFILRHSLKLMNRLSRSNQINEELMIRNAVMDKQTKTDSLTELYNHMSFHEFLDNLIEQSNENGLKLQLAMIDIDNFKNVNDNYGHRAGDAVLQRIANILRDHIGPNDFAARYGGEELSVIFTDQQPDHVFKIVEQLRKKIASTPHPELYNNKITVSIGLRSYSSQESKESFFEGADQCLYEAKRTGKNKTVMHRPLS